MPSSAVDPSALERLYNPRVSAPDFELHLQIGDTAAEQARQTHTRRADIRYGTGPRQLLDIFPSARAGAPVNIFFHGGFWRALSKDAMAGAAPALVDAGITCVQVGYDLCPAVTLPQIIIQAREAVLWVHRNIAAHGGDPMRLYISGVSAGAHLAAMTLAADWQDSAGLSPAAVRGAVLVSGLYDVAPVVEISVNEVVGLHPADISGASPLGHLPRAGLPLLVTGGDAETTAWIEQSQLYDAACCAAGAVSRFAMIPGAHHFSTGVWLPGGVANTQLRDFILTTEATPARSFLR